MFDIYKKLSKGLIIILFLLHYPLFFLIPLEAKEKNSSFISEDSEKLNIRDKNSNNISSEYLLGTGDELIILFNGIDVFTGRYTIDPNGNLFLPEIKEINVSDMTLKELKALLEKKYENFIYNPKIDIRISRYRPINVYITGEVREPGLYLLKGNPTQTASNNINLLNQKTSIIRDQLRVDDSQLKIYDLLRSANGLKTSADLSKIEIIRKNSRSQGGGKIKAEVNLFSMILNGDQSQNIRILDGDFVKVPKSNYLIKEQLLALNNININPNQIRVFVTGNIPSNNRNSVTLKKGSNLLQAVASVGGKKFMTGNVEFIRFNDDGTTKKDTFRFNSKAPHNSKQNPILMDGDIINVKRTLVGNVNEVLKEYSSPLLTGFALYRLFD